MLQIVAKLSLRSLASGCPLQVQAACRQISVIHHRTHLKQWLVLSQQASHLKTRNYSENTKDCNEQSEDDATFGTLSERFTARTSFRKSSSDIQNMQYEEDKEEKRETPSIQKYRSSSSNTTYWYFLRCKSKIKEGKLAEALELFEVTMLQEERLQPEEYNYTILIGACGRVGYVKKAFQLYSEMKKRGLIPTDATYTALFNACSESPWKESGLQYAVKLRKELMDKNIQLNPITYRSLLKAYSLCSGLQSSLDIFQEIVQKCKLTSPEAFNILFMACLKDKQLGFRFSLQVWRQMLCLGIKPDIITYNLILRATRDCGIGDPNEVLNILQNSQDLNVLRLSAGKAQEDKETRRSKRKEKANEGVLHEQLPLHYDSMNHQSSTTDLSSPGGQKDMENTSQVVNIPSYAAANVPNLLDLHLNTDSVLSLTNVTTPYDRFALIGDLEGILQKMKKDKVYPSIKTFTLIAEVMKPDPKSDAETLLTLMDSFKIKPDLTFFNTLILKRSETMDLKSAMELLPVLAQRGIAPNIHTFCNLAKACHKKVDGLQLLEDMATAGFQPNTHVYSTLINVAIKRLDYIYLTDILRDMRRRNVAPNEVVIRQLEFAAQYPPKLDKYQKKNVFLEKVDGFRGYYNRWLDWMDAEETEHPWKKYRTKPENDKHH
ncbi:PREDICTED: pentatricopeptide repeat-containing protein 1, mitochondrial [Nanorana parkeri]|uniref:pentatricopeptide repeat-containing protein 1, mitochondrial n=1 Tax=Nanorana parkeri TaxID=125878 RepID=UPI0008544A9D|nr:PREDICTED: pentatricopeptide repeat-containing protein 1, mitochondrial [Nanorana parkeri]